MNELIEFHNLILSCPFCGGDGSISTAKINSMLHHYIECGDCGASSDCSNSPVKKYSKVSILEAIAKWNKRIN